MTPVPMRATDATLSIPAIYLRHVVERVKHLGGDVRAWLSASDIDEARLSDAEVEVSLPALQRFAEGAIAATGEPALALFVGERLVATAHGMLGYAALASTTLRQALDVFERFITLRVPVLSIAHDERTREWRLLLRETMPLGSLRKPLFELTMVAVKNVLDAVTLGACEVTRVCFDGRKPEYADLVRDIFRCDVRFDQPFMGLVLPRRALDRPLQMADAAAFEQAAVICQRELDKLHESQTVASSVRRLLLEQQNGLLSLQATARRLHLTQRTLHRRLDAEGTSFREIVESVRRTLATEYLASGHHSIKEIAYALGYSDLANFRRAFKRWERVPPSAWRRR